MYYTLDPCNRSSPMELSLAYFSPTVSQPLFTFPSLASLPDGGLTKVDGFRGGRGAARTDAWRGTTVGRGKHVAQPADAAVTVQLSKNKGSVEPTEHLICHRPYTRLADESGHVLNFISIDFSRQSDNQG